MNERRPGAADSRGPVFDDELFGYQTDSLHRHARDRINAAVDYEKLAAWFTRALRDAYGSGLRDGYAQGVADRHHESLATAEMPETGAT